MRITEVDEALFCMMNSFQTSVGKYDLIMVISIMAMLLLWNLNTKDARHLSLMRHKWMKKRETERSNLVETPHDYFYRAKIQSYITFTFKNVSKQGLIIASSCFHFFRIFFACITSKKKLYACLYEFIYRNNTQKKLFRHVICCDYTSLCTRTSRVTIKQNVLYTSLLLSTEAHTRKSVYVANSKQHKSI